jgi:hypothetical protein
MHTAACPQTRLTDFSNCRTAEDMELTHLGTLKTVLSEVLLLSREQRRLRQSLSDGLGRLGSVPEDAASPRFSAASMVASSPVYREGRNPDEAAKGDKDPLAAASAREEAEALRTAVDGLAREVAGLQSAIKGLRWAQASFQAKDNVFSHEMLSGTPPVTIADDFDRTSPGSITNHVASASPFTSTNHVASASPFTSIYGRNRASGRRASTGGTRIIERSVSDSTPSASSSAASSSASMQLNTVVLVGRQSAAEPSAKHRALPALPFSKEAAACPAPTLCSSPLSPTEMPELQLMARGVNAVRQHNHQPQQQQQQQQHQPSPPQQRQQQQQPQHPQPPTASEGSLGGGAPWTIAAHDAPGHDAAAAARRSESPAALDNSSGAPRTPKVWQRPGPMRKMGSSGVLGGSQGSGASLVYVEGFVGSSSPEASGPGSRS